MTGVQMALRYTPHVAAENIDGCILRGMAHRMTHLMNWVGCAPDREKVAARYLSSTNL